VLGFELGPCTCYAGCLPLKSHHQSKSLILNEDLDLKSTFCIWKSSSH
jgi:hypothetical protein